MMASILVLGPTVSSKGKENLDINEPANKCFKVRMWRKKSPRRRKGLGGQWRPSTGVVWRPNANVLQAPRSKQGCGSAELPQKFRDQSATPHAPIDESAPALEISSYTHYTPAHIAWRGDQVVEIHIMQPMQVHIPHKDSDCGPTYMYMYMLV